MRLNAQRQRLGLGVSLSQRSPRSGLTEVLAIMADKVGALYDAGSLSNYYADISSTAASVNGAVGMHLDTSRGLALGSDARGSGAIGLVGTATAATYNSGTGVGTASRAASSANQSYVEFTLTANTWYRFVVTNTSASTIAIRQTDATATPFATIVASASVTIHINSGTAGKLLFTCQPNAATAGFTISSIRSLAGLHRYQTTAGSRPTLRGTPLGANLFTSYGTPEAGWVDSGNGVAVATASTGDIPTTTAPTNGNVYKVTYSVALTGGTVATKMGGITGPTRSASGTYVEFLTAASTAALTFDALTSFTGTISGIDVRDVSAANVTAPYWLQADGSDDGLLTPVYDLSGVDEVHVVCGLNKHSDQAAGRVLELSPTTASNNGSFAVLAPTATAVDVAFESKGTTVRQALFANSLVTAGTPFVLTGHGDISSDVSTVAVDGLIKTSNAGDQGTGNYGSAYSFFHFSRNAASERYNGSQSCLIIVGGALTDAERTTIESYVLAQTPGAVAG